MFCVFFLLFEGMVLRVGDVGYLPNCCWSIVVGDENSFYNICEIILSGGRLWFGQADSLSCQS